ncbi:hypothetical protein LOK46_32410 (plasmid) [Methylobacterium sp. NMS14P]|uniref:hypothetical protein n=1 Tax=Methylobacterium sp. NMS14P TaxID=2894310 RepID=UPI00235A43B8|nr:hypothetical protein [Methylobacterium sp. NMS14P]WCS28896.1 hypothetical protein LOK46_32410 [Methylobacterium sp. NMS14P]
MTDLRALPASLVLCILCGVPLSAQTGTTGTGGGPLSAEKAPNTTTVGQTKPPSRDASPTSFKPIERRTSRQATDDKIGRSICIGCGPDPSATGALPTRAPLQKPDVRLDELRAATEPKKQSDLNTFELASAHRERAESAQEKTDGLWQSWLVSVCDGCGDQKSAKARRLEDWPNRNAPLTTGAVGTKVVPEQVRRAEMRRAEARHHGAFEADLSPEHVDSIRRMPQR